MPADTSIYGNLLAAPRSAVEYGNDYARQDAMRNQNALMGLQLQQATASNQARSGIRNALAGLGPQATLDQQIGALRSQGTPEALDAADKLDTSAQTRIKIGADAAQANANAGRTTQETGFAKADRAINDITSLATPADALVSLTQHLKNGDIDPAKFQSVFATLQASLHDPAQFAQWKQGMVQGIMSAKDRMGYMTPDANAQLQATTSTANTAANNATSRANTAATQAGEDARASQSRSVQLKLGGYDANGNMLDLGLGAPAAAPGDGAAKPGAAPAASPLAGLVDSIGTYKSPESVALARVPPALKSQVLAAVMQKFPDYDPSTFGAKQKAARDFSTGQQGNAMRSFAVAGQHLDQLGPLIDALDNGNNQTVNQLGNAVAKWNGGTAVTNFDAAKDVVGKEVIKAIVGSGGGVDERQELARQLSTANSPAQLRGIVKQYRSLMSAQHDALHSQRLGAGLPDSTMPKYGEAGAEADAAGAGWKILGVH